MRLLIKFFKDCFTYDIVFIADKSTRGYHMIKINHNPNTFITTLT